MGVAGTSQLRLGLPREQAYNQTMYILVGMLIVGLICNLLVTPLAHKWFMTDAELAVEKKLVHEKAAASVISASAGCGGRSGTASATPAFIVALA